MMYNGHKRVHAIKFQSVALPNGLIANLYGPVGKDLFNLLLFINKCQVYEKSNSNGKGTNMVSEGSCFPLQVSVLKYNLRQTSLVIRAMKR